MRIAVLIFLVLPALVLAESRPLPDTGISGVYEVVVGTSDARQAQLYFRQFGFENHR